MDRYKSCIRRLTGYLFVICTEKQLNSNRMVQETLFTMSQRNDETTIFLTHSQLETNWFTPSNMVTNAPVLKH